MIAIPSEIKTSPKDVIIEMNDFISNIGKEVFLLIKESYLESHSLDFIGCENIKDLGFFAAYYNVFGSNSNLDRSTFIRGTILDPENLPYDVTYPYHLFLIYDGWDFKEFYDVENATYYIERQLNQWEQDDINDCVCIMGLELSPNFKSMVERRMISYKNLVAKDLKD